MLPTVLACADSESDYARWAEAYAIPTSAEPPKLRDVLRAVLTDIAPADYHTAVKAKDGSVSFDPRKPDGFINFTRAAAHTPLESEEKRAIRLMGLKASYEQKRMMLKLLDVLDRKTDDVVDLAEANALLETQTTPPIRSRLMAELDRAIADVSGSGREIRIGQLYGLKLFLDSCS